MVGRPGGRRVGWVYHGPRGKPHTNCGHPGPQPFSHFILTPIIRGVLETNWHLVRPKRAACPYLGRLGGATRLSESVGLASAFGRLWQLAAAIRPCCVMMTVTGNHQLINRTPGSIIIYVIMSFAGCLYFTHPNERRT